MNEQTDVSWADFWKYTVLMQYECPAANCSTPQDRRRWMLGGCGWIEYHHCNKKLTHKHAFPLVCQPKQMICGADTEGESMSLRQGVTGWRLPTAVYSCVHSLTSPWDGQLTDRQQTDWHRQLMHIWPSTCSSNNCLCLWYCEAYFSSSVLSEILI